MRGPAVLTALLLGSALPGCVYFNTFYNAEKYYAEGEELVRDAPRGESLPPSARTAFEKSIEKSSAVLAAHGDSKYADDALLLLAKAHHHLGNHAEAAAALEVLLREHPESDLRDDAMLWLARAGRLAGDVATATRVTEQLLDSGELSREERFALELERAQLAQAAGDAAGALALLTELERSQPDLARRNDVDLLVARARLESGDAAGALAQLRTALTGATDARRERRVAEAMTEALGAAGDGQDVRAAYGELLAQGVGDSLAAAIHLALARGYAAARDTAAAAEAYAEAARRLPATPLAAQALYRRGILQWRGLGERGNGRETLLEAYLQAPQSAAADSAVVAARTIAEIEHYEAILSGTERVPAPIPQEEVRATATYLLAELLFTAEDDPARARALFEQMLARYPGSEWTPKVLYTLGWMDLQSGSGGATTELSPYRERLLREFPDTEYALYARQRLAAPEPAPGLRPDTLAFEAGAAAPGAASGSSPAGEEGSAPPDSATAARLLAAAGPITGAQPAAASAAATVQSLDVKLLALTRALPRPTDPLVGLQDRLLARQREVGPGAATGLARGELERQLERQGGEAVAPADSVPGTETGGDESGADPPGAPAAGPGEPGPRGVGGDPEQQPEP
ncbi:MAG: tol-pal system YbgF family protein [Gemmatimonadota bacterium]